MSRMRETDRRLFVGLAGGFLVFVTATSYLFLHTLQVPVFRDTTSVTVELERTGGLYEGSAVTYRGTRVGVVRAIELGRDGGAVATLRLDPGVEIPVESRAKVRSLSPVGEQYLDFQPSTGRGPYLVDGGVVAAEAVDLPVSLASTVINLNALMAQIDPQQLRAVVAGLRTTFEGRGGDLATIFDTSERLLKTLDDQWPTISRVLVNTESLLRLGQRHGDDIRSASRDLRLLARELRNADPDLRAAFKEAPRQFADLIRIVGVLDRTLPPTLRRTIDLTDILVVRDPHLRELLRAYPVGIRALGEAMYDGAMRGQLMLQTDYQCLYDGPHYPATDTHQYPLYTDGQCAAPDDRVVRGAKQAPRPTGN